MDLYFSDDCDSLLPIFGDDGHLDGAESALPESLGFEEGQPHLSWCPPESHDDGMPNGVGKELEAEDDMLMPSNSKMRVPASWEGDVQLELVIYEKAREQAHGNSYKPHVRESAQVLARAFGIKRGMDDVDPSLAEVLTDISSNTNYEVEEVVRIQNQQRYSMHRYFKQTYDLPGARIVYHGTTRASAASIATTGFRGAVSQRAKFGRGIYCSSVLWEALAYAEPEQPALTQTFLVVDMLQGPTAVGMQDQVDFGVDSEGREILTTTNPEATIFCSKYENQLLATYRISVRYLKDRVHTPTHYNSVRMYHPTIWKIIKEQAPTVGRKPALGGVSSTALPATKDLEVHNGISKGQKVVVQKPAKAFLCCNEQEGVVRKITKVPDGHVYFSVEMCDAKLGVQIKKANKTTYPGQDETWINCKIGQLRKAGQGGSASTKSSIHAQATGQLTNSRQGGSAPPQPSIHGQATGQLTNAVQAGSASAPPPPQPSIHGQATGPPATEDDSLLGKRKQSMS